MANKYPPSLPLNAAIKIVENIYGLHDKNDFSIDLLPKILNVSKNSSYFVRHVAALKEFGLLEKQSNDIVALSDLAEKIVKPLGKKESLQAVTQALRSISVLADLYEKYPNGKFPSSDDFHQKLTEKPFNIERKTVGIWHKFIQESFSAIPSPSAKEEITEVEKNHRENPEERRTPERNKSIPLLMPSKREFSFVLDENYDENDLEFIIGFFQLMQKGKQAGQK